MYANGGPSPNNKTKCTQTRTSQKTAKMHLTFFFFCTTAVFSSIFARNGAPGDCCLRISPNQVSVTSIVSYWQQDEGLCPITAIAFTLENGKVLCSDPVSPWTKKAMRKVDEEAEQKRNHRHGQAPDAPQNGTEGLLTSTMLPLTSRWPQVPASVAMWPTKVKSSKPQRGSKKRIVVIKKKRKNRKKGGKGKRKITKPPVFNHTSSFTTSSYK
ncbi:hypothetical protein PHYPO_G00199480 [Pangasianodon hypophthalmus]|uniref:Chemokine interleukin-8-like domain-containing protein n=1 Tax=Pangasianodon hypophthalmus TaxID=310915 RepID=A0A5N5PL52_PANHP|nr:hypothetical protein PHYPO_G00199480 [Pangasianodon hypophthalmus]